MLLSSILCSPWLMFELLLLLQRENKDERVDVCVCVCVFDEGA